MKTFHTAYAVIGAVLVLPAIALAAPPAPTSSFAHTQASTPGTTATTKAPLAKTMGQPNQSCGSATAPNTPGNASSAPGSAFNPNGKAGTVYAGEQPQNSVNPKSVSQYDVACARQPR